MTTRKGSKHGVTPATVQVGIIRRFMTEPELARFIEKYQDSSYKTRRVRPANDVDKRLVASFKKLGSITETAEIAHVSTYRIFSALSRVTYSSVE